MSDADTGYLGELRRNARPLAAAAAGSASGLMVAAYTTSVFSPYLITQFHWSRAQFALIGLTLLSTLAIMPVIGRLTDRLGVRPMAGAGVLLLPLCFIGYSFQTGNFLVFMALSASVLATGSLTSPAVYTRLIAENFVKARGLALFIVTAAPALAGMILPRVLVAVCDHWGWRTGYRVLAAYFLIGGLIAVALVPRGEPSLDKPVPSVRRLPVESGPAPSQPGAFREIARQRAFWIITGAMMLCVLPTQLHAAQMMLMLGDAGLDRYAAANAVSCFALGGLIGRGVCGLALDRLPAGRVAAAAMVLPALGYMLIAGAHGQVSVITGAMLLVGLSYGAENDLPSFLVARYFRLEIFSSAMSLVYCGILFGSAFGALLLAGLIRHFNSFTPFLWLVSASILAGSLLFLLLPARTQDVSAER